MRTNSNIVDVIDYDTQVARIDLLLDLRRASVAEAAARELVAAFPQTGGGYAQLARCLVVQNRFPEAIAAATVGVAKNPRNAWVIYILAFVNLSAQQFASSRKAALDSLAVNPEYSDARHVLAATYIGEQQFEQAEKVIREGLEKDPDHLDLRVDLVRVAFDRKQFETAARYAHDALSTHPESDTLQNYLGISLWSGASQLGLRKALRAHREATEHIAAACRRNPGETVYAENLLGNALGARNRIIGIPVAAYVWIHLAVLLLPFLKLILVAVLIMRLSGKSLDVPALPAGLVLTAPLPAKWFPPGPPVRRSGLWKWVWRGLAALFIVEFLLCVWCVWWIFH